MYVSVTLTLKKLSVESMAICFSNIWNSSSLIQTSCKVGTMLKGRSHTSHKVTPLSIDRSVNSPNY